MLFLILISCCIAHVSASSSAPVTIVKSSSNVDSKKIGLILALYNANITTDWLIVEAAAHRIPITVIVPVQGVSPPDPQWAPTYNHTADEYRAGVAALRNAGASVYAYAHLRNIDQPCCECCGNLTQFEEWVDIIHNAANFTGVMMDNLDPPWRDNEPSNALHAMYIPAANIVKAHGLEIIANGPHLGHNDIHTGNTSEWKTYLDLSPHLTTLFEIPLAEWRAYPSDVDFSEEFDRPASTLGGYILDIPNNASSKDAIETSLKLAVKRGLGWLYPTVACEHSKADKHACTYASLPVFWDLLVDAIESINED